MRDLEKSFDFNFSRLGSNGWHNFSYDDNSRSISILPRYPPNQNQNTANTHSVRLQSLLN